MNRIVSAHKLIENVLGPVSRETFNYISLVCAKPGQFGSLKRSRVIRPPELRQKTPCADRRRYGRGNFVNGGEWVQFNFAVAPDNILAGPGEKQKRLDKSS